MMKQLHSKLRSRTGASITYALLLFLVCAVIGGAVLAAGTTATGRMARVGAMDQRYYAVTSAADLLVRELTGKTVTITRRQTTTSSVTKAQVVNPLTGKPETQIIATSGPTPGPVSKSVTGDNEFLKDCAEYLLFGGNAPDMTSRLAGGHAKLDQTVSMLLRDSSSQPVSAALSVSGTCDMESSGRLVLTLQNTGSDYYRLRVTLNAVIVEPAGSGEIEPSDYSVGDTDYSEVTETKTATIYWVLDRVEKVGGA